MTSLLLPTFIGTIDRKKLLLALTFLMGISGAIIAVAPNYMAYMLGRGLIGVVIGGF
ncbi:MFS transporter [Vibrio litoralis]|uniref:MFS transporter n=1 Tax=Vibrio litoralis TaxID=335972 RepID=UPI0003F8A026